MDYGKIFTTETYHQGKLKSTTTRYIISRAVSEKSALVSELLDGLKHLDNKETCDLVFRVIAEPHTFKLKRVEIDYEVAP